jgi:hypothetical protein
VARKNETKRRADKEKKKTNNRGTKRSSYSAMKDRKSKERGKKKVQSGFVYHI